MSIEAVVTAIVVLAATARAGFVTHPVTVPVAAHDGGSSILVLGDSMTMGDRRYLRPALEAIGWRSVKVDGEPSRRIPSSVREPYSGVKIVRALRAASAEPDAYVIALGTNDIGFVVEYHQTPRALITQMLDAIGPAHRVLWIDVVQPDLPEGASWFNHTLDEMADEHPERLVVLRWSRAAASHPEWFLNDGIHLSELGHAQRSALVAQASLALRGGAAVPPALPPVPPSLHPGSRGPRAWRGSPSADPVWARTW